MQKPLHSYHQLHRSGATNSVSFDAVILFALIVVTDTVSSRIYEDCTAHW